MGAVKVSAPLAIDGWLLAPTSELGLDNTLKLRGAAYVGSLRVAPR